MFHGPQKSRWAGIALALFAVRAPLARAAGPSGLPAFPMPESSLTLRAPATAFRFLCAPGRQAILMGYATEGLEGWVYPFRIFHDLRVGFRAGRSNVAVPGSALVRRIVVNPESATRIYSGQNFTVRETLFAPLKAPGFVLLYQVESRNPLHIEISFRPDLDLMWPGGMGGQNYAWDPKRHAFILEESSNTYSALVGSPAAGRHSSPSSYAEPWNADRRLSLELDIPASSNFSRVYPLLVAAKVGTENGERAGAIYDSLLARIPQDYAAAVAHYRQVAASGLEVKTPDPRVNLAYAWARMALDQAEVCNPDLGCGLIAGYGPSRDTRRPQYDWFFGGDAMINTLALEASGDHELARDALRFLQKYQNRSNGEIPHEISQSAARIDWFKRYPFAYRHTDASAMYLIALDNMYRVSGDREFLQASWKSLRAAYGYLLTRVDPSDGLVTIPPGGWGGDETSARQVVKDIYLESIWAAGARAMEDLGRTMGDAKLAADAQVRAERARASIEAKFWDAKKGFFAYGYDGGGNVLKQEMSQVNWGIWLGVFDPSESNRALDRMARADWEADWGVRSIPTDDSLYIGDSYGHGSVWPLGTGVQALAFFRLHRPLDAFGPWRALIEESFLNSLGHVPEVFSGDYYRELDVSVPEQIWSSGMVITSLVRGLLGLEPDAPDAKLTWTPHLPANWPRVELENLKIGSSKLNLALTHSATQVKLEIAADGPPVEIEFQPEIPMGAEQIRAALSGRQLEVGVLHEAQDVHAAVKFTARGKQELVISFTPGLRVWLPWTPLRIGERSQGLRILSALPSGHTYEAQVEGIPAACRMLVIESPWTLQDVQGGKLEAHAGGQWRFVLSPRAGDCRVGAAALPGSGDGSYETWTFRARFAP